MWCPGTSPAGAFGLSRHYTTTLSMRRGVFWWPWSFIVLPEEPLLGKGLNRARSVVGQTDRPTDSKGDGASGHDHRIPHLQRRWCTRKCRFLTVAVRIRGGSPLGEWGQWWQAGSLRYSSRFSLTRVGTIVVGQTDHPSHSRGDGASGHDHRIPHLQRRWRIRKCRFLTVAVRIRGGSPLGEWGQWWWVTRPTLCTGRQKGRLQCLRPTFLEAADGVIERLVEEDGDAAVQFEHPVDVDGPLVYSVITSVGEHVLAKQSE